MVLSSSAVRRTGRTRRAPGQWWKGDLSLVPPPPPPPHAAHVHSHISAAEALATEEADPETFRRHEDAVIGERTRDGSSNSNKDDEPNIVQKSPISIVDGHEDDDGDGDGGRRNRRRHQGQQEFCSITPRKKNVSKSSPTLLFPLAVPSPPHPLSLSPSSSSPLPYPTTTSTTITRAHSSQEQQHTTRARSLQHPSNRTSSSSADRSLSPIPSCSTPSQNEGGAPLNDGSTNSQQSRGGGRRGGRRRKQEQQQQVLPSSSHVHTQAARHETESIVPNAKNRLNPQDEMQTELPLLPQQPHEVRKEPRCKRARLLSDHSISGDDDDDHHHHHHQIDTNDVASDRLQVQLGNNDEILENVAQYKPIRAEHNGRMSRHNAEARVMVHDAFAVDVANEDGKEKEEAGNEEEEDNNDNDQVHEEEVQTAQTADNVNRNKHVQVAKHEACILDEISRRSPSSQVALPRICNNNTSPMCSRPNQSSSVPRKRARRSHSTDVNTTRNSNEDEEVCNATVENSHQESDNSNGSKQQMTSTSSPHPRRHIQQQKQQQQQQQQRESPTFLSSPTLAETGTGTEATVGINEKHSDHQEQRLQQQQQQQNRKVSHDKVIPSPPKQHAGRRRVQFLQAIQTARSPRPSVSHRVSVGLDYDGDDGDGDTGRHHTSVMSVPQRPPIPNTPAQLPALTEDRRTNEQRMRTHRPIYKGVRVIEGQPGNTGFDSTAGRRKAAAHANDENPTGMAVHQIRVDNNTDLDSVPLRDRQMDCDTEGKAGTAKDIVDHDVNTRTTHGPAKIHSSVGQRRRRQQQQQRQQEAATLTTQTITPAAAETAEATLSQRRYYHLPEPIMSSPPMPSPSQSPVHLPLPDNSPPQAVHRRAQQQDRRRHLRHGNLHRRRDLPSVMVVRDTQLQFFERTPSQRSSPAYTDAASAIATSGNSWTTNTTLSRREQEAQRRRRRYRDRRHYHHHHQYQHAAANEHNRHVYDVVDDMPLPVIPPPVRCALATTMDCAYVGEMMLGARCSSGVRHVMVCEETYHISHCFLGVVICETRVQTFRLSKGDYIMVERGDAIQFRNPSYITCRILFIQARQASS